MFLTRARDLVGLDIGSHAIKMVALRPAKGDLPFELTHFGRADLPEDAIVDGAIAHPEVVSDAISELLDQHKVRGRNVATSVSGNAVIIRRVTLPRTEPDKLRQSLPYEAESHIPFDVHDVDLDFAILSEDPDQDTMEVVLVAARRERVDEYVSAIEDAKRKPTIVDVDAFAIQNAFEYSYPERQFEDIAILNLGATVTNLAVLREGKPSYWRDISVGMRQYTQALQRHFMLDAIDAEDLLYRVSRAADARRASVDGRGLADWSAEGEAGAQLQDAAADPRVHEAIGEVSERIITEVRKTLDFYEAQAAHDHFDAIFLCGGGAHIADLRIRMEERTGWAVERFDPMRRIAIPEGAFDPEYVWESGPQAAVAVGLALRGVME